MPSRAELVLRADALGFDPDTIANDSKLEQHILYLEKNASTMAGTLATGTLTSDATAQSDGDEVTIGDITYTFKTALSEAKATGTITTTGTFSDGELIQIDGITYRMSTAVANPYDVLIGASAAASLDNLKSAINDTGTEGTHYGTGTEAHPKVTATTNADDSQVVAAKNFGTYANVFLTTTTAANATWGAGAMAGGVDPVANEVLLGAAAANMLDNLKSAINDSGTEGTDYSTGTAAHPQVTATTNTDTTQVVAARDMAVGEDIATTDPTDTGNHMAWGATTLASGVADQNAVDATAAHAISGGANKST